MNARGIPTAAYQVLPKVGTPLARSDRGVPEVVYPHQGTPARSNRGTWSRVPPVRVPPGQVLRGRGVTEVGYPRSQVWPGVPEGLMGGTQSEVPPSGYPPSQVWWGDGYPRWGTPPGQVWWGVPEVRYPSGWTWPGYPPPPEMWTDRHLWKQYLTVVLRTRSVNIIFSNHFFFQIFWDWYCSLWCTLAREMDHRRVHKAYVYSHITTQNIK